MIATYRLQLRPEFTFADVEARLPYFRRLGVSHLYLSPITEARPGSTHGYDVVDHNAVREDLGGREGFDRLLRAADDAGLALILDFVPNHAGVGPYNGYWQDVLAFGPDSPYARYFDIDWHPLKPELGGKILLPFLGGPYGQVLDDDELGVEYDDGRFYATYYDQRYALSPASYHRLIAAVLPLHERTDAYWDLRDLLDAYESLERGEREKAETLRHRVMTLEARIGPETWTDLEPDALHELLEDQHWRLSYWKTAGYEINYRRFFDINGLVGLRMEDAQVFWDAHRLLAELTAQPGVDGVRIDHVDGLFDPHGYLRALEDLGAGRIWVEKILARGETLPDDWPVEGTTGYEFMNDVMGVLLPPGSDVALDRVYRRFVDNAPGYEEAVYASKTLAMTTTLSSELFRLAYELDRLSEADYHTRDFTLEALREALMEIVAAFERYRTYLPHDPDEAREVVNRAVHRAQQRNRATEPTVYTFVRDVILGDVPEALREAGRAWTGRFQQYTAPVAAKGVEDTAFYRYLRLAALNEVGGEPDHYALAPQAFHSRARFRALRYPNNLLAGSTHDHKRGEETRMRLLALAARPGDWESVVSELTHIGDAYRDERGPGRSDAYLFFQLLVALWDDDADRASLVDRLADYMLKASRESKRYTSWINEDATYEAALDRFVRAVAGDDRTPAVVGPLADALARLGSFNALTALVLRLTTPGVPDVYQGTERPDLTLVDPDNRRPVDYDARAATLDDFEPWLDAPDPDGVRALFEPPGADARFYTLARLLRFRGAHQGLFDAGYRPLDPEGDGADHYLAFARETEDAALVVVVGRFPDGWAERGPATLALPETLHGRTWTDVLTGATVSSEDEIDLTALPLPWAVLHA